jgi:hypothetical protein
MVDPPDAAHDRCARQEGHTTPHQRPQETPPANLLTERKDAKQQALHHSHQQQPPHLIGVERDPTGNGSGDQSDQKDQHCRQERSEQPPRRHTEPDHTGTEDARQDGPDRGRQHDADHELVKLGLAAVEHWLRGEENSDVEDDQPGENTMSLRLSSAGSIRLLVIGPAVLFAY